MRGRRIGLALIALSLAAAAPANGQWAESGSRPPAAAALASAPAWPAPEATTATRSELTLAGLGGGLLGMAVLGGAGYLVDVSSGCGDYFCGVAGGLGGAFLGEVIGLPLGVHLANGRRGNFGLEVLSSAGIAVGGLLIASGALATENPVVVYGALAAIPILQLKGVIALERR